MSVLERRRLEKILGRFNKKELPETFELLGLDSVREVTRKNKRELISCLVDKCLQNKVSSLDILRLELNYAVTHCNSLLWRAYQLERLTPAQTSMAELDSQIFSKRLQLYLGEVCSFEMVDDMSTTGYYWYCLHMMSSSPYTCYILRSPSTPYLYLAGVRKTHLSPLLEALCVCLECGGCVDLDLSGRNLDSLLDLTMNKNSQGPYAKYRLNPDPSPLLGVARRRTRCDSVEGAEATMEGAFGSNPLPKLQRFVFKLHVNVPGGTDSIHSKVKLTGSNVMEGMRECFLSNCASLPVPQAVRCMALSSTNVVSVVETSGGGQTSDSSSKSLDT